MVSYFFSLNKSISISISIFFQMQQDLNAVLEKLECSNQKWDHSVGFLFFLSFDTRATALCVADSTSWLFILWTKAIVLLNTVGENKRGKHFLWRLTASRCQRFSAGTVSHPRVGQAYVRKIRLIKSFWVMWMMHGTGNLTDCKPECKVEITHVPWFRNKVGK